MTRGLFALAHGDVLGSLALNPGSVVLAAIAVSVLAVVVFTRRPPLRVPTWLPLTLVTALWSFQLFKYATGRPI